MIIYSIEVIIHKMATVKIKTNGFCVVNNIML